MKTSIKNNLTYAFTMIELVFVIVIVGILSVMIAPNFQGNNVRQATDQIVSHIRYTQHLAMMDNKFDQTDPFWFRERWNISFDEDSGAINNQVYGISNDRNQNQLLGDVNEYATNPLDSSIRLSGDFGAIGISRTETMDLTAEYGITDVNNTCSTTRSIYFDNLGRPYGDAIYPATAPYQNLIEDMCTIVITDGNEIETIEVYPETGYVKVR